MIKTKGNLSKRQDELDQVQNELAAKRAALGSAVLRGGDPEQLSAEIARLDNRRAALVSALAAGDQQAVIDQESARAAEIEKARAAEKALVAKAPDELERHLASLQAIVGEIDSFCGACARAAAAAENYMPRGDVLSLRSVQSGLSQVINRFEWANGLRSDRK